MAKSNNARPRGRRITLEIPEALYARLLIIARVQKRRSLSALVRDGLTELADRLTAERHAARDPGASAQPHDPD